LPQSFSPAILFLASSTSGRPGVGVLPDVEEFEQYFVAFPRFFRSKDGAELSSVRRPDEVIAFLADYGVVDWFQFNLTSDDAPIYHSHDGKR
jgi:hypothetical protein